MTLQENILVSNWPKEEVLTEIYESIRVIHLKWVLQTDVKFIISLVFGYIFALLVICVSCT